MIRNQNNRYTYFICKECILNLTYQIKSNLYKYSFLFLFRFLNNQIPNIISHTQLYDRTSQSTAIYNNAQQFLSLWFHLSQDVSNFHSCDICKRFLWWIHFSQSSTNYIVLFSEHCTFLYVELLWAMNRGRFGIDIM